MFTDKKIIESKPLNLMGLQVLRALGARFAHRSRRIDVLPGVSDKVRQLEREGIVLCPEFLPANHFDALCNECLGLVLPAHTLPRASARAGRTATPAWLCAISIWAGCRLSLGFLMMRA